MKNLSRFFTICVVLLAVFMYSCDKEVETSSYKIDQNLKGTIKGTVFADLDLNNYGKEPVAGQKVIISIPYSDLGLSSSAGTFVDTVFTSAEGVFTYVAPVDLDGTTVTAKICDFTYPQKQPLKALQPGQTPQNVTILKKYPTKSVTFSTLKPTETQLQKIDLDAPSTYGEIYYYYKVSGQFKCERDSTNGTNSNETVPSGQKFIFSTTGNVGWSAEVITSSDGKYEVMVPGNEKIKVTYFLVMDGKNTLGLTSSWKFDSSFTLGDSDSGFSSDKTNVDKTLVKPSYY